jgi:hypothetical protein
MVFSKKNGLDVFEREFQTLEKQRETLAEKLAAARSNAEQAMQARRSFLLSSAAHDAKARADVDRRVVDAQAAEIGIEDALTALDEKIVEARLRLDAERMQQTVEAEIALREGHASYVEEVLPEFLAVAARLEKGVRALAEPLQFVDVAGLSACLMHIRDIVSNVQKSAATYRAGIVAPKPAPTPAPTPKPKLDDRPTNRFYDSRGADFPKFVDVRR